VVADFARGASPPTTRFILEQGNPVRADAGRGAWRCCGGDRFSCADETRVPELLQLSTCHRMTSVIYLRSPKSTWSPPFV